MPSLISPAPGGIGSCDPSSLKKRRDTALAGCGLFDRNLALNEPDGARRSEASPSPSPLLREYFQVEAGSECRMRLGYIPFSSRLTVEVRDSSGAPKPGDEVTVRPVEDAQRPPKSRASWARLLKMVFEVCLVCPIPFSGGPGRGLGDEILRMRRGDGRGAGCDGET